MDDTTRILFGANQTTGLVAIEAGESEALLYIRRNGKFAEARAAFNPWLLVSRREDIPTGESYTELKGEGFRFKVSFPDWSAFLAARSSLRAVDVEMIAYPSPEKQFLTSTGYTLFKGLTFDEIHRMQLDIETTSLSAEDESSRIILIALTDNQGYENVLEGTEPEMLSMLISIIQERNPDVIEGHNLFGFDLPFLAARARKHGIKLALGRDGSEMTFGLQRSCPIGGYSRPFIPAKIYGRHIIDTLLAVQRFDVAKGQLESHGLKECVRALGLSEPERIIIPGDKIVEYWEREPETVKTYCLQDVRETRSLAALVCPAEFYLTQMVPDTYGSVATTGNGEKINSILIREYLRRGYAIPKIQPSRGIPGGYTELRKSGLIRHVVKCDVESLYPSLMLSRKVKPASDVLDVFLPALSDLTCRRIEAKSKAKSGPEPERAYWDGLQSSFKILINSFYGYLGAPFNFNDFDAAEQVTTEGQAIVKQIAESIEKRGGRVIEIDTDGVYFQAPIGVTSREDEELLIEGIDSELTEGIHLVHDGRYAAMLSLKIKNYALIDYNGKKILRGSSIRSRADEHFGREFISQAVDLLLRDDKISVGKLYSDLLERIKNGNLPIEQFVRRERVTSKTFNSSQKKRSALIAQGVPIGEYITVYDRNDGELALAENYNGDENRDYLAEKLYKFACRLRDTFGDDFSSLFPKPGINSWVREVEAAGQQRLDF